MSAAMPRPVAPEPFDIAAAIAPELSPLPIPPGRGSQLRQGLMARIHRSALVHREFSTVRREDAAWSSGGPGVRRRALSAVGGLRVDLVMADAGATIPWPQDALAQEILVVDGSLHIHGDSEAPIRLTRLQQRVLGQPAAPSLMAGSTGATLYVRRRTVDLDALPAGEAQWWITAQGTPLAAADPACPWAPYIDGVEAAVLQAHGDVASMLIRIAPGATVPDHGHALDEDCFMLEGDMFLGDILMRAGDYQLAPVGCQHVGISSDLGGVFYFHGAVPPAASEPAR
jgi:quercetin dioxygenase-like cupin family protein